MSDCTHDLSERETAVADGYCPMCLVSTIEQLQADNIRLVDELEKQKCNAAFYKCSALCGEKFKDGDEPFPPPKDK